MLSQGSPRPRDRRAASEALEINTDSLSRIGPSCPSRGTKVFTQGSQHRFSLENHAAAAAASHRFSLENRCRHSDTQRSPSDLAGTLLPFPRCNAAAAPHFLPSSRRLLPSSRDLLPSSRDLYLSSRILVPSLTPRSESLRVTLPAPSSLASSRESVCGARSDRSS